MNNNPIARSAGGSPAQAGAGEPPALRPLLEAVGVNKFYPDGNVHALQGVSIAVAKGDSVAIMGPSGSGKSTLLHLLGALDHPDSGEIRFDGKPLSVFGSLDAFRSQKIGFVFQSFFLLPTLTAIENVQIPMFESNLSAAARTKRARELLDVVGMGHRISHLPAKLSVGERQRVAIARALANDPPLLLADEPTGNLDSRNAEHVLDLFGNLHRQHGKTLVIVTHSADVAERAQCVIRLRDGRIDEAHAEVSIARAQA